MSYSPVRPSRCKPTDPSLRFSSNPETNLAMWRGLADEAARTHFLSVALARDRLDVLLHAGQCPLPVGDFVGALQTPLRRLIAKNDNIEALEAIVRLSPLAFHTLMGGPDQDSVREFGAIAIKTQAIKLWRRLLDMGLDPFVDSQFGTTITHMVASHGWLEGLEAVDEVYPDMIATLADKSQRTLLHTAARYGQQATVRWLLGRGAQVQARDKNGRSPLFACVLGHTEGINGKGLAPNWPSVAMLLMLEGATPNDHIGKTTRSAMILEKLQSAEPAVAVELDRLHKVFVQSQQLEQGTVQAAGESKSRRL